MGDIQKRLNKKGKMSYTARIRVQGYPVMSATFQKKQDAETWIQDNESKMRKGMYINDSESLKHTLANLIDRYIENELPKRVAYGNHIKHHLDWWKNKLGRYYLANLTPAKITECKELLENEPNQRATKSNVKRSPATVNRYLASLSLVLNFACKNYGWLNENPMQKVIRNKEKANKDRILTPEEIEKLLKACYEFDLRGENYNKETHLFINIALGTGARYSEIRNLKWENVDFKHRQFYFLNTKNGENRGVPITNDVYRELLEFKKIRNINSDYLFTTKDGKKLIDMHVRFYKVIELAKIENFRFHDIRHTVASNIAMNGGSLLDIAQVTGHKTMQMVKRYSHLTINHTAELLEKTNQEMLSEVKNK